MIGMLAPIASMWAAIRAYAEHEDPLVRATNTIALVVVSNQPFYPLYLYWFVGPETSPSYWLFLSTPFFLAVPAVARRNALAGRALLPIVGIANAMLSAKVFGIESGVELFLIPCALIAFAFFRPNERIVSMIVAGAAWVAFAYLHGSYGDPLHRYTGEEYGRFLMMNATSAGTLCVFIGLLVSNMFAAKR